MCARPRQWTRPLKRLVNFISVVILFSLFFLHSLARLGYVITPQQRFFFLLFCVCMNYKYSLHIVSVQDEIRQLVLASSNNFYHFVMMMISTQMQAVIQQQQQQKLRDANWNAPLYICVVMDLRPNKILFNIKIGFRLDADEADDGDEFIKKTNYSMFPVGKLSSVRFQAQITTCLSWRK